MRFAEWYNLRIDCLTIWHGVPSWGVILGSDTHGMWELLLKPSLQASATGKPIAGLRKNRKNYGTIRKVI